MASLYDSVTKTEHVIIETDEVAIEVDATTSEDHSDTSTLTQNPIESGAMVSDHVIDNPIPLTLDIVISDDPLKLLAVAGNLSRAFTDADKPSLEVYDFLKLSKLDRKLFTITTTLDIYFDMILIGISVTRTASTSRGLFATLQFQNIRVVETETTQKEGIDGATTDSNTKKSEGGKEKPKAATEAQEKPVKKSLGYQALESVDLV